MFEMNELGLTGNARINTPFKGYRTMAVSANKRGNNLVLAVQKEEEEFSLTTSNTDRSVSFTLTTPLSILNKLAGSISYDNSKNFKQQASLEYNQNRLSYQVELGKKGSKVGGKIIIETPLPGFRNIEVFATHDGSLTNFNNNAYVLISGQRYAVQSEFRVSSTEMHLMLGANIPQEYSLTLDFSGTLNNFTKQALIKYNGNTIASNINWQIQESKVSTSAVITTPFPGYETIKSTFNHTGGLTSFSQDSVIEYGTNEIKYDIEFTLDGNETTGFVKMLTPFYPSFVLNEVKYL